MENMESKTKSHNTHYKKTNKMRRNNDRFKKFVGNRSEAATALDKVQDYPSVDAKGQGFADKRKKKIQHEYLRMLSKEKKKALSTQHHSKDKQRISSSPDFGQANKEDRNDSSSTKGNRFRLEGQFEADMSRVAETSLEEEEEAGRTGDFRFYRPAQGESFNRSQNSRKGFRKQQYNNNNRESSTIFSKAMDEAKAKRQEFQRHRQEKQKEREDRQKALEQYRKKKKDNYFKFHCKKTTKGQPVMKYQMEFLLQKIMDRRERDKK